MSVEYHFFSCKNKRIIGGFVRDEDGVFDYESVFYGKSNVHWQDLSKYAVKLNVEDIDPMDYDFLTYEADHLVLGDATFIGVKSKAYYISKDDIEDHASECLQRGFMRESDAVLFSENDYDEELIYDGIVDFISNEEYLVQSLVNQNEKLIPVCFIDYDRFEYTCFRLNTILWGYPDADGVIVTIE